MLGGIVAGGGFDGGQAPPWVVPGFAEERELGRGASGRVVAAVHVSSGYRAAIKYLSPAYFQDPEFLARFRAEAAVLRSLADPHVVRLFDYVEEPGRGAAILMELVAGVSLHTMITEQGPTTAESALAVLKGSLQGLAAAHALGIVHRDYKPENVLVEGSGLSKLTDFGIAARAGDEAAFGGTPQYMAPEQWDGSPPSPATDIYAATAVFFECLTGKTPFSGGIAQLQAAHATAAVPVEQVDEPLRELMTRGMAKDPTARPADAARFMSELETTAATAYGGDWESRGRSQLAERAAALLLLLLHGSAPATATGAGTTTASTYLGGAAKTATRVGLHGWRAATLYSALFVAVFIAVAGGIVGVSDLAHGKPRSTVAAGPTSGGPSSGSTTTTASSPACGKSGLPALAYVTTVGSASPLSTFLVRCGTGAPHTLATVQDDFVGQQQGVAWSADGTQLAWATSKAFYVATAKAGTWTMRQWTCQCGGAAFFGDQAVSVNTQSSGGPQNVSAAVTQLLVYPQSGSAQPVTLPVTGIPGTGTINTEFRVLGNVSPDEIVVDWGDAGGSDDGGAQFLFHVNPAGQATEYGNGTLKQVLGATPSTIFGYVSGFIASPAGSQLAFSEYSNGGACGGTQEAKLLDTATGTVSQPATLAGGGPDGYWIEGMWFDKSGTPYASLVPNESTCQTTGNPPAGGISPAGVTPTVVKLSGGRWVAAGSGTFRVTYGPGSWVAEQTGTTPGANDVGMPLTISGGTGTAPVKVAAVTSFAWEPTAA